MAIENPVAGVGRGLSGDLATHCPEHLELCLDNHDLEQRAGRLGGAHIWGLARG